MKTDWMMEKQIRRIISVLTMGFFLVSQVAFANPGAGIEIAVSREMPSFLRIDIPSELATLDGLYEAPPRQDPKLILHIQNAHANYEAQQKIKELLQYLEKRYAMKTIFVEGSAEDLNPDYLKMFPDRERNLKLAEFLAKQGELTGAELYLLEQSGERGTGNEERNVQRLALPVLRGEAVKAHGIEDAGLYRENYEALQKVFGSEATVKLYLEGFEGHLSTLASKVFSKDLLKLLGEWKKFEKGHRAFMPYVRSLAAESKRVLGIDLESLLSQIEWPQTTRLLVLQALEKELDMQKGLAERDQLIKFLREKRISAKLVTAIENFQDQQVTVLQGTQGGAVAPLEPRDLMEQLVTEAGPKGFYFYNYPHFSLYAGYLILKNEIDPKGIFGEIRALFMRIMDRLAVSPREKKLLELFRNEELVRKLLNLELTRKDWQEVLAKKDLLAVDPLVAELKEIGTAISQESGLPLSNLEMKPVNPRFREEIRGVQTAAYGFYEAARKREDVFYEKIDSVMRKESLSKAVLITGGFHTDGITELLREHEISYGTLTPRLSEKNDENLYRNVMLQNKPSTFELSYLEAVSRLESFRVQQQQLGEAEVLMNLKPILKAISYAGDFGDVKDAVDIFNQSAYAVNAGIHIDPVKIGEKGGKPVYQIVRRSEQRDGQLTSLVPGNVPRAKEEADRDEEIIQGLIVMLKEIKEEQQRFFSATHPPKEVAEKSVEIFSKIKTYLAEKVSGKTDLVLVLSDVLINQLIHIDGLTVFLDEVDENTVLELRHVFDGFWDEIKVLETIVQKGQFEILRSRHEPGKFPRIDEIKASAKRSELREMGAFKRVAAAVLIAGMTHFAPAVARELNVAESSSKIETPLRDQSGQKQNLKQHPELGEYKHDLTGEQWISDGFGDRYVYGPDYLPHFSVKETVKDFRKSPVRMIAALEPINPAMQRFSDQSGVSGFTASKLELRLPNINADLQMQKRVQQMLEEGVIDDETFVIISHGHFIAGAVPLVTATDKQGQHRFDVAVYFPQGAWSERQHNGQNALDMQYQLWGEKFEKVRSERAAKGELKAKGKVLLLYGHRGRMDRTHFKTAHIDLSGFLGNPEAFKEYLEKNGLKKVVIVTEEPTIAPKLIGDLPISRLKDGSFGEENKDLYDYMAVLSHLVSVRVVGGDMRPPAGLLALQQAKEDAKRLEEAGTITREEAAQLERQIENAEKALKRPGVTQEAPTFEYEKPLLLKPREILPRLDEIPSEPAQRSEVRGDRSAASSASRSWPTALSDAEIRKINRSFEGGRTAKIGRGYFLSAMTTEDELTRRRIGVLSGKTERNILNWWLERVDSVFEQARSMNPDLKKKDFSILEVGSGDGLLARELASRGYRVTGMDFIAEFVKSANQSNPYPGNLQFVQGDATNLDGYKGYTGIPDNSVDLIVSNEWLGSVPIFEAQALDKAGRDHRKVRPVFEEFFRKLRPGGFYIMNEYEETKGPDGVGFTTQSDLGYINYSIADRRAALQAAGFQDIQTKRIRTALPENARAAFTLALIAVKPTLGAAKPGASIAPTVVRRSEVKDSKTATILGGRSEMRTGITPQEVTAEAKDPWGTPEAGEVRQMELLKKFRKVSNLHKYVFYIGDLDKLGATNLIFSKDIVGVLGEPESPNLLFPPKDQPYFDVREVWKKILLEEGGAEVYKYVGGDEYTIVSDQTLDLSHANKKLTKIFTGRISVLRVTRAKALDAWEIEFLERNPYVESAVNYGTGVNIRVDRAKLDKDGKWIDFLRWIDTGLDLGGEDLFETQIETKDRGFISASTGAVTGNTALAYLSEVMKGVEHEDGGDYWTRTDPADGEVLREDRMELFNLWMKRFANDALSHAKGTGRNKAVVVETLKDLAAIIGKAATPQQVLADAREIKDLQNQPEKVIPENHDPLTGFLTPTGLRKEFGGVENDVMEMVEISIPNYGNRSERAFHDIQSEKGYKIGNRIIQRDSEIIRSLLDLPLDATLEEMKARGVLLCRKPPEKFLITTIDTEKNRGPPLSLSTQELDWQAMKLKEDLAGFGVRTGGVPRIAVRVVEKHEVDQLENMEGLHQQFFKINEIMDWAEWLFEAMKAVSIDRLEAAMDVEWGKHSYVLRFNHSKANSLLELCRKAEDAVRKKALDELGGRDVPFRELVAGKHVLRLVDHGRRNFLLGALGLSLGAMVAQKITVDRWSNEGARAFDPKKYEFRIAERKDIKRLQSEGWTYVSNANPFTEIGKKAIGWLRLGEDASERTFRKSESAMMKGIFLLNRNGDVRIRPAKGFDPKNYPKEQWVQGFQAGPMAITNGELNLNIKTWHRGIFSGRKSVIGVDQNGRVYTLDIFGWDIFGWTGPTSARLMEELEKWEQTYDIKDALFVDGGDTGNRFTQKTPATALMALPRSEMRDQGHDRAELSVLFSEAHLAYMMETKEIVNPDDGDLDAVYPASGAGFADIFLSLNPTRAIFMDVEYKNMTPQLFKEIIASWNRADMKRKYGLYILGKHIRGFGNVRYNKKSDTNTEVGRRRLAELMLLELDLMGVDLSKLEINSVGKRLELVFGWAYPENEEKKRTVTLIDENVTDTASYAEELFPKIDVFYLRAAQAIPMLYQSDGRFLEPFFERMSRESYFVTDDHAFDPEQENFTDLSQFFPHRTEWELVEADEREFYTDRIRRMIQESYKEMYDLDLSGPIVGYGWEQIIRRVTADGAKLAEKAAPTQLPWGKPEKNIGKKLGPYTITEFVSMNGPGDIYQAVETKDQGPDRKKYAVKIIPRNEKNEDVLKALGEEARLLKKITLDPLHERYFQRLADYHSNVDGLDYLVTDWIDGERTAWIKGEREQSYWLKFPDVYPDAIDIVCQLLVALGYLHYLGIIHGDVKPQNIIPKRRPQARSGYDVKLIDFDQSRDETSDPSLPRPRGTPAYASPEQRDGGIVDYRADLYSAGRVLDRFLSGYDTRFFHQEESALRSVLQNDPRARYIWPVIKKACAQNPEDRYASALDMLEALADAANKSGFKIREELISEISGLKAAVTSTGPAASEADATKARSEMREDVLGYLRVSVKARQILSNEKVNEIALWLSGPPSDKPLRMDLIQQTLDYIFEIRALTKKSCDELLKLLSQKFRGSMGVEEKQVRSLFNWMMEYKIVPRTVSPGIFRNFIRTFGKYYRVDQKPRSGFHYRLPENLDSETKLILAIQNMKRMEKMFSPRFRRQESVLIARIPGTPYLLKMSYGFGGGSSGVYIVVEEIRGAKAQGVYRIRVDTQQTENGEALRVVWISGFPRQKEQIQKIFPERVGLHPGLALFCVALGLAQQKGFAVLSGIKGDKSKIQGHVLEANPGALYDRFKMSKGKGANEYTRWEKVGELLNDWAGETPKVRKAWAEGAKKMFAAFENLKEVSIDNSLRDFVEREFGDQMPDGVPEAEKRLEGRLPLPGGGLEVEPIAELGGRIALNKVTGRIKFMGDEPAVKPQFTLIGVRHGTTLANEFNERLPVVERDKKGNFQGQVNQKPENQLTPEGKLSAEAAAKALVAQLQDKIDAQEEIIIIVSPEGRAVATSKAFMKMFKAAGGKFKVIKDKEIREGADEIDFGFWDNKTPEEVTDPEKRAFVERYRNGLDVTARPGPAIAADGTVLKKGESFLDLLIRVKKWMDQLNKMFRGRTVVVFGHGTQMGALRVLLGEKGLTDDSGFINWRRSRLPNARPVLLSQYSPGATAPGTGEGERRSEVRFENAGEFIKKVPAEILAAYGRSDPVEALRKLFPQLIDEARRLEDPDLTAAALRLAFDDPSLQDEDDSRRRAFTDTLRRVFIQDLSAPKVAVTPPRVLLTENAPRIWTVGNLSFELDIRKKLIDWQDPHGVVVQAGGGNVNIARALRYSGEAVRIVPVFFYGGETGDYLRKVLVAEGISTEAGIPLQNGKSNNVMVVAKTSDKDHGLLTKRTPVSVDEWQKLVGRLLDPVTGVRAGDTVTISSVSPTGLPSEVHAKLSKALVERGAQVIVDTVGESGLSIYKDGKATIYSMNHNGFTDLAEQVTGEKVSLEDIPGLIRAAQDLLARKKGNFDQMLVTLAAKGAFLVTPQRAFYAPNPEISKIETEIGAGDTARAAVALSLIKNEAKQDPKGMLVKAVAAGAASVEMPGTGIWDPARAKVHEDWIGLRVVDYPNRSEMRGKGAPSPARMAVTGPALVLSRLASLGAPANALAQSIKDHPEALGFILQDHMLQEGSLWTETGARQTQAKMADKRKQFAAYLEQLRQHVPAIFEFAKWLLENPETKGKKIVVLGRSADPIYDALVFLTHTNEKYKARTEDIRLLDFSGTLISQKVFYGSSEEIGAVTDAMGTRILDQLGEMGIADPDPSNVVFVNEISHFGSQTRRLINFFFDEEIKLFSGFFWKDKDDNNGTAYNGAKNSARVKYSEPWDWLDTEYQSGRKYSIEIEGEKATYKYSKNDPFERWMNQEVIYEEAVRRYLDGLIGERRSEVREREIAQEVEKNMSRLGLDFLSQIHFSDVKLADANRATDVATKISMLVHGILALNRTDPAEAARQMIALANALGAEAMQAVLEALPEHSQIPATSEEGKIILLVTRASYLRDLAMVKIMLALNSGVVYKLGVPDNDPELAALMMKDVMEWGSTLKAKGIDVRLGKRFEALTARDLERQAVKTTTAAAVRQSEMGVFSKVLSMLGGRLKPVIFDYDAKINGNDAAAHSGLVRYAQKINKNSYKALSYLDADLKAGELLRDIPFRLDGAGSLRATNGSLEHVLAQIVQDLQAIMQTAIAA